MARPTADLSGEQLSRISTLWTLVQKAHGDSATTVTTAQRQLMERYCGAVYRYLLGALRQEEAAMDLFQEFALRFLRGDFHRVTARRGRFRDYLKTCLINLVNDHHRQRRARPAALPDDVSIQPPDLPDSGEIDFDQSWREEIINRTWQRLAQAQPTSHAVLLLHLQHPDLPSPQLATLLQAQLHKPFTPGSVRVALHRARLHFADLALDEVKLSLDAPSEEELEEELKELQLVALCRPTRTEPE